MAEQTLLFTDVVDSTAWVQRWGDQRAAQRWAEHDRLARALLAQHGGREIDRSDGFFLIFDDSAAAARFALQYHEGIAALGMQARLALHRGAVVLRQNSAEAIALGAKPVEVDGLAKPLAARLMSLARGGQTLLSVEACASLDNALPPGCLLEDHGHYRLKGIDEPVQVFELAIIGVSPLLPPADADKAYRVVRDGELWRPLREVRHNLAPEPDAFIGRNAELRSLAQRLEGGARLLTLLGVGGTGKTRLACRYARAWLGDWPGGVAFCDLSEARSLEGILFAVASALGVPLGKGDSTTQLGHAIAGRGRCLVILDNFEQVLAHAAATLGHWRDRAAQASYVVTSRELLHLPGEEVFAVDPLALDTEAVELFEARARARLAGFELDAAGRAAVYDIARLLDGLPLAIELAAARASVLSPAQIVQRLQDRFALLAGARGAGGRQATLRAAIDWSWNLLAPWEQGALAQCTVFEGGFTMEAAEAVLDLAAWPAAPATIDVVQALVDKSLLRSARPQARPGIAEPRFGMYLSIHEYAAGQLRRFGAASVPSAERAHGRHFAGFGSDAALEALSTHGGVQRLRCLALELDNLVAACRRAMVRADAEIAVPSYRAAWEVLDQQGPFAVGVALGAQLLSLPGLHAVQRGAALLTSAAARRRAGQMDEARAALEEALGLATDTGSEPLRAQALYALGALHRQCSRYTDAIARLDEALACHRALAHRNGEARAIFELASIDFEQGRAEEAQPRYPAALALLREAGNRRAEGDVLNGLGTLSTRFGHYDEALAHFEAALTIYDEVGARASYGLVLGNMGVVFAERGRVDDAWLLFERTLAIARSIGDRRREGFMLGNMSEVRGEQQRWAEAAALSEAALLVHREVRNRRVEADVLGNLCEHYQHLLRMSEAQACGVQALAIHRELGNSQGEAKVNVQLAWMLLDSGNLALALEHCTAGEALARRHGDMLVACLATCTRAEVQAKLGNLEAARAALAEVEAIASSMGSGPASKLRQRIEALRMALSRT